MVADLSRVTFLDSSGINALITAHLATGEAQGWLRLVSPPEPVLRVLRLVGIHDLIPRYPALADALNG